MWVLKQCYKCKEIKELQEFVRHKDKSFGRDATCIMCNRKRVREWVEVNKEKARETKKKWSEVNKEKTNERSKKYYKTKVSKDPFMKFKWYVRTHIRRSFKRVNSTKSKNDTSVDILGMSIEQFHTHIEKQFTKGMTLANYGEWHLDHIVPISYANNEEEVLKLCHYSNYQPLWASDNVTKWANFHPVTNLHFKETFES